VRLWILASALLSAADARADEHDDPKLPSGAVLAVIGGSSMVAGGAWLGAHEQEPCPPKERCSEHGVEGASLGLLTGGFVAAAMGIGISYGASIERNAVPQRNALQGTGVVLTGLCAAGVVGSSSSLAFLLKHRDPALLAIAPSLIASAATCGLGVPFWIAGTRPSRHLLTTVRETASEAELDAWPVRSPTMTAVGLGMTSLGALMIPAGFTYGLFQGRQRPGAQGQGGMFTGLISGIYMALPPIPLVIGGSLLLRYGVMRVPPGWDVSLAPMSPGGVALTLTTP
jgi:hypothetical protein